MFHQQLSTFILILNPLSRVSVWKRRKKKKKKKGNVTRTFSSSPLERKNGNEIFCEKRKTKRALSLSRSSFFFPPFLFHCSARSLWSMIWKRLCSVKLFDWIECNFREETWRTSSSSSLVFDKKSGRKGWKRESIDK